MFIPIAAFLSLRQVPKTFQDLELDKIKAYYGQKNFHEVVVFTAMESGGKLDIIHRDTIMDGTRSHVVTIDPNGGRYENIDDGKDSWIIFYPQKTYEGSTSDGTPFDPQAHLLKTMPNEGSMTLNSEMPFQVAYDPAPEIKSIETVHEGDKTLRKVVCSSTNSKGQTVTITQWFLPDRWLLERATVKGVSKNGPVSVDVLVSTMSFNEQVAPSDFTFDPATLQGFTRVFPTGH